jgi:transposase
VSDVDLKASLLSAGWNPHLPAIRDEHGTLLVGNRRMAIARAHGIAPVVEVVSFGDGPEADAARARLAVVSNVGSAGITPGDRRRVAERLYQGGMTQAAIGAVMGVSQQTVMRDLDAGGLSTMDKPARPKGGRPRGSGKAPKPRVVTNPEAVEREQAVSTLVDQGLSTAEIAKQIGLGERNTAQVIEHVRIAKEAHAEGFAEGSAKAAIDPRAFFGTAQEQAKQLAERYYEKIYERYDAEVKEGVEHRTRKVLDEVERRNATADQILKRRGRVMTVKDYNLITRCLHPDTSQHVTEAERTSAVNLWLEKKPLVLIEAEAPLPPLSPLDQATHRATQQALGSDMAQRAYAKSEERRLRLAKLKAQQAVAEVIAEVAAEAST